MLQSESLGLIEAEKAIAGGDCRRASRWEKPWLFAVAESGEK
jgi:hypothetical protein